MSIELANSDFNDINQLIEKNENFNKCVNDMNGLNKACHLDIQSSSVENFKRTDNVLRFIDSKMKVTFNRDEYVLKQAKIFSISNSNPINNNLHHHNDGDLLIEYEFNNKNIEKANDTLSIVVIYEKKINGNTSKTFLDNVLGDDGVTKLIIDDTVIPDAGTPFVYAKIYKKNYIFYFRFTEKNDKMLTYNPKLDSVSSESSNDPKELHQILSNVKLTEYDKIYYNELGRTTKDMSETLEGDNEIYIDCRPTGTNNEETELYAYTNVKKVNEETEEKDEKMATFGKLVITLIVISMIFYIVKQYTVPALMNGNMMIIVSSVIVIIVFIYGLSELLKKIK